LADRLVRLTGILAAAVAIVVPITLIVRHVDLNGFIVAMEVATIAASAIALRTRRALPTAVLLVLAMYPTLFGWYVFFYLPLVAILAVAAAARPFEQRRPPAATLTRS
jgi:hypothetical protein